MNYSNLPTLLEHLDRSFRLDMTQEWPHDAVLGWWRDIPCKVTRYVKRSSVLGCTRPVYTIFSVLLEGQVIASWGAENAKHEDLINQWFAIKRGAVVDEQCARRSDLEKLFKHG